jgi:hypothetical protein
MPAAYTFKLSVQVLDFEDIRLLIQLARLVCDFCSSSQRFACGFLQIPPRDGHPCRPAYDSPCRVRRRLSLPSECALRRTNEKTATRGGGRFFSPEVRIKGDQLMVQSVADIRSNVMKALTIFGVDVISLSVSAY